MNAERPAIRALISKVPSHGRSAHTHEPAKDAKPRARAVNTWLRDKRSDTTELVSQREQRKENEEDDRCGERERDEDGDRGRGRSQYCR
jgi:hypothetical protein